MKFFILKQETKAKTLDGWKPVKYISVLNRQGKLDNKSTKIADKYISGKVIKAFNGEEYIVCRGTSSHGKIISVYTADKYMPSVIWNDSNQGVEPNE